MSAKRTSARARVFWIALPIAIAFALCAGPGLATDDEMPSAETEPAVEEPVEAPPPALELECEPVSDYGPDGDG
jgi:hypothetical protein